MNSGLCTSTAVLVRPFVFHPDHQQTQQREGYEDDQAVVHPVKPVQNTGRLQAEHPEKESREKPAHLAPGEGGQGLRGRVVNLHQQLIKQGYDAPETEHTNDGGDVDGRL